MTTEARQHASEILQRHLATQGFGGSDVKGGMNYRRDQLCVDAMLEYAALQSPIPGGWIEAIEAASILHDILGLIVGDGSEDLPGDTDVHVLVGGRSRSYFKLAEMREAHEIASALSALSPPSPVGVKE